MEDQKNFVTFILLSTIIMLGYWTLFGKKNAERMQQQAQYEQQAEQQTTAVEPIVLEDRDTVINKGQRIPIDTPSLSGSFLVEGSRFDDISLKNYKQTLAENSPDVVLLTPEGADQAAYVFDNWVPLDSGTGANTQWSVVSGDKLTVDSPVVLRHEGSGFIVERTISADDRYLITLDDKVTNTSGGEITLTRKGMTRQHGIPKSDDDARDVSFILHQGAIAIVDDKQEQLSYKKMPKERRLTATGDAGWTGMTDKYWLSAAIAPQGKNITADFQYREINDAQVFEAGYTQAPVTLTSGATISSTGYIFAGAKDRATLRRYEKDLGIAQMERAIDWGRLRLLTRPMNTVLSYFGKLFGNYGLAILALTTIIKLLLFPMFNKQYASQAKMKKVAPKQKKIQELYKDDRMKQQQEIMALYRKEGVNPMAGCLPIIPTIFVFFALYKTVFINVELRHAPFFGWIRDLSARDPLSILNGFGAFPWDGIPNGVLAFLAIGPLAILYGISMSMTFSLSSMQTPASGGGGNTEDIMAMQMKIFKWMPWIFMFVLAPFAAGLLVYWIWSNVLSFAQQYYITRKYNVDTKFDKFFRKLRGKDDVKAD